MVGPIRAVLMGVTVAILGVHGCTKAPEPAKPVSWYLAHQEERQTKVSWCADDAARKDTPDCRNALEASERKAMGRMSDAPPLNWNQPDKKP